MNGLTPKLVVEAAKHPLVAIVLVLFSVLWMFGGMLESQEKRYDRQLERDDAQVEVIAIISQTLINLDNGQEDLIDSSNDFLDGLIDQAEILKDLVWQIKQIK